MLIWLYLLLHVDLKDNRRKKFIHQPYRVNTCLNMTMRVKKRHSWCLRHSQVVESLEVQGVAVFLAACPGQLHVSYSLISYSVILLLCLFHTLIQSLIHLHPQFLYSVGLLLFPQVSFPPPFPYCSSAWTPFSFLNFMQIQ